MCGSCWSRDWTNEASVGHRVELKSVSGSTCEVNDRIAGIEPRNDSFRRIKLEHCADIGSETGNATSFVLQTQSMESPGRRKELNSPSLKLTIPGRAFPKMPQLSKRFPAFTPPTACITRPSLTQPKHCSWKEITRALETEDAVQVVSKPASQSRFSSAAEKTLSLQRSELCREFEFRRIL